MTTTASPNPLPPDLLAKAAEALAACEDWDYEYPGVEARAEKLAEAALLAADVPGLLAEIERLRAELAGRPMARCSTVGCDSTTDGSHYWTCQGCARKAEAECERLRAVLANVPRLIGEQNGRLAQERNTLQVECERLNDLCATAETALSERFRLTAQRNEARAALAECEDKLDDIIYCMGGDENDGWNAPENVWGLAQEGRTIARRVLGKGEA